MIHKLRSSLIAVALCGSALLTGCMKPYDAPEYVDVASNETAFLILRNLAGLPNSFRDLEPKLLRPTPPAPPTAKIDVTSNPA